VITEDVLESLDDLGLAVWYQDDGTLVKAGHRASRIACKIPAAEQKLVVGWLAENFGDGVKYNANSRFIHCPISAAA
jgi:hypothetical protein